MGWGKRSFLGFCLAWFYLFWCMLILGRAFIPCPDKAVAAPRGCPEITLCDVSAIAFLSQGCTLMEIVTGAVQENLLTVLPISWQEMGLSLTSAVVAPVLCLHRGLVEPLMPMLWDQLSKGMGAAALVLCWAHRGSRDTCLWLCGNHQASRSGCCADGKRSKHKND